MLEPLRTAQSRTMSDVMWYRGGYMKLRRSMHQYILLAVVTFCRSAASSRRCCATKKPVAINTNRIKVARGFTMASLLLDPLFISLRARSTYTIVVRRAPFGKNTTENTGKSSGSSHLTGCPFMMTALLLHQRRTSPLLANSDGFSTLNGNAGRKPFRYVRTLSCAMLVPLACP